MDRYELKEDLGNGSFGRVIKARHRDTGNIVAIKHMKRKFQSWKEIVHIREVSSLRNMSHPNIVHIQEVILERDENLYFVFEYMAGGSLYELMKRCITNADARKQNHDKFNKEDPPLLSAEKIKIYVQQILSGLSYIHDHGYIHRDIKPENILLHGNGRGCKVADFGLARQFSSRCRTFEECTDDNDNHQLTYYVSTRWYRAPEVILRCHSYGPPIDLFATGLVLAELHSLRPLLPGTSEIDQLNKMMALLGPPSEVLWEEGASRMKQLNFSLVSTSTSTTTADPAIQAEGDHDRNNLDLVESGIRRALPENTSSLAIDLIRQLIAWNPLSRLNAKDALEHDYFHPLAASRQANNFRAQLEESNEGVLFKGIGSHIMDHHHHHSYRHNVGEILVKQGGEACSDALRHGCFQSCAVGNDVTMAMSSIDEGFQLEQEHTRNSMPFDMEHHHHFLMHNVGEIIAEDEHGQTTTLPENVSIERDENAIPIEGESGRHLFRHNVCEIMSEHRKLSSCEAPKNNLNPPMPTMLVQQENEFCNYLDAISNASQHQGIATSSRYHRANHQFGTCLQPIIESDRRSLFHRGLSGLSNSRAVMQTAQTTRTSNQSSITHREMSTIWRDGVSNTVTRYGRLHRQRAALAEKPRWLLSNQNMGRGAMEVSVSRMIEPNTFEHGWTMDWDDVGTRETAAENPFECFDDNNIL